MVVVFPIEKSGQVALVTAPAVLSVLSIVAVILRVVARRMANRALDWSDCTIIVACVSETPSVARLVKGGAWWGARGSDIRDTEQKLGAFGDLLGHHHVRFVLQSSLSAYGSGARPSCCLRTLTN